jgi:hypothetical protein
MAKISGLIKDKADRFDAMVEHEERIRLDEAGWKERYYKVCVLLFYFILFVTWNELFDAVVRFVGVPPGGAEPEATSA